MDRRKNKEYYFRNNEAFTADHIRIYNIFVSGISPNITKEDLENHFSQYGEIMSVTKVRSMQRRRSRLRYVAFINYVDSKGAALALKCKHHIINMKRLHVTTCYSWHQPEGVNDIKSNNISMSINDDYSEINDTEIESEQQTNSSVNIFALDDDILHIINSHFDMKDKLAFASTCKPFQKFFLVYYAPKYRRLNIGLFYDLTYWETRIFFELCGQYITTLKGYLDYEGCNRIAEFCPAYCNNVTTLDIYCAALKPFISKKFICKMTTITEIEVSWDLMTDYSIFLFAKYLQLKVLRVQYNLKITGIYLSKLIHLEELCLEKCTSVQPMYLAESLKLMKNLRILDIRGCNVNACVFNNCITNDSKIEILKMTTTFESITELPRLRHLEIIGEDNDVAHIFHKLVDRNKLEVLVYSAHCGISRKELQYIAKLYALKSLSLCHRIYDYIPEQNIRLQQLQPIRLKGSPLFKEIDLLNVIKQCRQLTYLNIMYCIQITKTFVFKAVKILKEQQRTLPLHIVAYGSGIDETIELAPKLKDKKGNVIVKLWFNLNAAVAEKGFFDSINDIEREYDEQNDLIF